MDADGSQDALLVRVRAGAHEGWGECEASPLVSIAAFVCPPSHGVCRPVGDLVLGRRLDGPEDIAAMAADVARYSQDILQADHTWSGIEMALWDALGKAREEPVWRLLGYEVAHPKTPYCSVLFGDTPQETLERARAAAEAGYEAAKFGWGPVGAGALSGDADQLHAAREGLGPDRTLLVDVGQVFGEDVERAAERLPALAQVRATWLEEPFHDSAFSAYSALAARSGPVGLAGGEGAHDVHMARHLIDYGKVRFVQIDCGRIGGIGPAKAIADYAVERGVTYVNHTFTSHLALSASLQPYAGLEDHVICEYPGAPRPLAVEITATHLERGSDGKVRVPDEPGLGIAVDPGGIRRYLVDAEITVGGRTLYRTPTL
jgi:L-alanine-DL-glutamate epimerase-like enolase superfamily enzyme